MENADARIRVNNMFNGMGAQARVLAEVISWDGYHRLGDSIKEYRGREQTNNPDLYVINLADNLENILGKIRDKRASRKKKTDERTLSYEDYVFGSLFNYYNQVIEELEKIGLRWDS